MLDPVASTTLQTACVRRSLILVVLLAACGSVEPAVRDFTNLEVLAPASREDLLATMRQWSAALGVTCGYCHVGREGRAEFASDARPQKRIARGMLRMTRQINRTLDSGAAPAVTCYTCHRGRTSPPKLPGDRLHLATEP